MFQLIPKSCRFTTVSSSMPIRCLPYASVTGPEIVPASSTGLVTPFSVSSPWASKRSPSRSIIADVKRSSGLRSASKKSGVCRWAARLGSSTSMLVTRAVPARRPSASVASKSPNSPLKVIVPV